MTVKLAGYFDVPSIEHYVVVDWEERELMHHRRTGAGLARPSILNAGILKLDPPGIKIEIAGIFGG